MLHDEAIREGTGIEKRAACSCPGAHLADDAIDSVLPGPSDGTDREFAARADAQGCRTDRHMADAKPVDHRLQADRCVVKEDTRSWRCAVEGHQFVMEVECSGWQPQQAGEALPCGGIAVLRRGNGALVNTIVRGPARRHERPDNRAGLTGAEKDPRLCSNGVRVERAGELSRDTAGVDRIRKRGHIDDLTDLRHDAAGGVDAEHGGGREGRDAGDRAGDRGRLGVPFARKPRVAGGARVRAQHGAGVERAVQQELTRAS